MEHLLPHNSVRPFLFEHLDIRGAMVRLREAWQLMSAGRGYVPAVARLLGEMSAVTALIAANLKQPGRMTFQLKGDGPVSLLVLDCDQRLRLRGMARARNEVSGEGPALLGAGQLALTLDMAGMDTPYQSLVPLVGDSIGGIFEHYLERSEQTPTRLLLCASEQVAAGIFLQKLPGADSRDPDGWNRIRLLADTVHPDELLGLTALQLVGRLFPEEDVRLFDPRSVAYDCPEDWGKLRDMLRALGREECEAVLREQGVIQVHDEMCNRDYRFDAAMVAACFGQSAGPGD